MKKTIIFITIAIIMLSCEPLKTWEVTTTITEERWNAYQGNFIGSRVLSTTKETVVDMSEEDIIKYCISGMTMETYGSTLYKVITRKTYIEIN